MSQQISACTYSVYQVLFTLPLAPRYKAIYLPCYGLNKSAIYLNSTACYTELLLWLLKLMHGVAHESCWIDGYLALLMLWQNPNRVGACLR